VQRTPGVSVRIVGDLFCGEARNSPQSSIGIAPESDIQALIWLPPRWTPYGRTALKPPMPSFAATGNTHRTSRAAHETWPTSTVVAGLASLPRRAAAGRTLLLVRADPISVRSCWWLAECVSLASDRSPQLMGDSPLTDSLVPHPARSAPQRTVSPGVGSYLCVRLLGTLGLPDHVDPGLHGQVRTECV
jgi:hypothetical protein